MMPSKRRETIPIDPRGIRCMSTGAPCRSRTASDEECCTRGKTLDTYIFSLDFIGYLLDIYDFMDI